jgi:egghead protein (zeste-white 4 protein)
VPFICFRVVTKGDFPELVRTNVQRNVNTCLDAGLENFMVEVVTDKSVNLAANDLQTRELVVPTDYKTKSGAMFKARALQYCLEDTVKLMFLSYFK